MSSRIERKLLIQMADPSGNRTAFVLSGARKEDYQSIARYIMDEADTGAEQVAFVKSTNAFDMSGMEFCGNAVRAFALMSCGGMIDGKISEESKTTIAVTVSGASYPVICGVDLDNSRASASIPLPKRIRTLRHCEYEPAEGKTVVVMEGIVHLIADGLEYSSESFDMIRKAVQEQFDPPAVGVMFLDTETLKVTPVVYVSGVGSTFIEGSCGSGSAACAYWLSTHQNLSYRSSEDVRAEGGEETSMTPADGTYDYEIKQPAGTIHASCTISGGKPSALLIEGPVELSRPEFITAVFESGEDEISAMSETW